MNQARNRLIEVSFNETSNPVMLAQFADDVVALAGRNDAVGLLTRNLVEYVTGTQFAEPKIPDLDKLPKKLNEAQIKYLLQHVVLAEVYTDGVDEITRYQIKGGVISGEFRDENRRFSFVVSKDGKAEVKTLNPTEFDEPLFSFAATKSRNCTKGMACGNSCIARSRTCRITLGKSAASAASAIGSQSDQSSGGGSGGAESNPAYANHKPFMTEAEAIEYTRDSVFQEPLYHGTSSAGADSITTDGADPGRTRTMIYGRGFYMANDPNEAENYAFGTGDDNPQMLSMRVLARNPRQFMDLEEFYRFQQDNGLDPFDNSPDTPERTTAILREQGHDSLYIAGKGYIVAFDREQVVTYDRTTVSQWIDI